MISEIFNRISVFFPYFVESKKEKFVDSGSDSGDSGVGEDFTHLLTLATIISTISKAIEENNYSGLDEITKDIAAYEGQFIELDSENLRNFCLEQLNLDLEGRNDHQHINSNILSRYNFNDESCNRDYSEKELILLAIAANDKLTKKYENILFTKENLSLLPLLVGGKEYISIFIEKFPDLYSDLKKQTITLPGNQTIVFFSVIALRKEPELLNAVFLQDVLNDLTKELQEAKDDPLYGILETAALIENKGFIEIILNSIEERVNEKGEKELLKNSFISFLDTAISQEHASIVKYLCEKCNKNDDQIQKIYKEALADDKIFKALIQQKIIEKAVNAVSNEKNARNAKAKEIYNLVLTTASRTGSVELIKKILQKIESVSTDDDKKFLQYSPEIILERGTDGTISLIKTTMSNLTDESVKKIYNEVWNEKILAKERNNTTISTNVLNGDGTMKPYQSERNTIKGTKKSNVNKPVDSARKNSLYSQLSHAINSFDSGKVESLLSRNMPSKKIIEAFLEKTKDSSLNDNQKTVLVQIEDLFLKKLKCDNLEMYINKNTKISDSTRPSSSGSNSGNSDTDDQLKTSTSSEGSPFSVIGSDPSTSGDEKDKDDDNTLVKSQSQENVSTGKKVVETGQVDEKVQGSSTKKDQTSNNGDKGDNKSSCSLNSESLEKENITVIELSGTTTASCSPFTPSACSTPATNQQIRKHDGNNSVSSNDEKSLIGDDQSKTSEQFKDNGNTDSENIKRSAASIVAISTLAIAAAALVAASIYFEVMLTAGAIAGACCLAAAVITYFYTQPSTSLKNTTANEQNNLKVGNVADR